MYTLLTAKDGLFYLRNGLIWNKNLHSWIREFIASDIYVTLLTADWSSVGLWSPTGTTAMKPGKTQTTLKPKLDLDAYLSV